MLSARLLNQMNKVCGGELIELTFFFRHKHIISLNNYLWLAQGDSLPCWSLGNFFDQVCLIYRLREFPFTAVTNSLNLGVN